MVLQSICQIQERDEQMRPLGSQGDNGEVVLLWPAFLPSQHFYGFADYTS